MAQVSVSQLKAKMGRYMEMVRKGQEVVITDRGRPVARLCPFEAAPTRRKHKVQIDRPADPNAPPLEELLKSFTKIDYKGPSLEELLLEDRNRDRARGR